ncbi:MAG: hypothetical protein ACI4P4_09065 [Faecousia sp.]
MYIRPSSDLRNNDTGTSDLAKSSGEPFFITNEEKADGVFLSMETW